MAAAPVGAHVEQPGLDQRPQLQRDGPEGHVGHGAVEGGTSRKVGKGDYVLIPSNTPHWYTDPQGLAMMTIHMPVPAK